MIKKIPGEIIAIAVINFLMGGISLNLFRDSVNWKEGLQSFDLALAIAALLLFTVAIGILFLRNWARRGAFITGSIPILIILWVPFGLFGLNSIGPEGAPSIEDFISFLFFYPFTYIVVAILCLICFVYVKMIKYLLKPEIKNLFLKQ